MPAKNKFKALALTACSACLIFGLWYLISHTSQKTPAPNDGPTSKQNSSIEALKSLPYVTWTPITKKDKEKYGITRHAPELTYSGVNVFSSENLSGAFLMNMFGEFLHEFKDKRDKTGTWKLLKPYGPRNAIVLIEDQELFLIDWDSNIKWTKKMRFHHDFAIAENGDIFTLINKKINDPKFSTAEPILDNCLVILSKDGQVKKEISFAKMISQDKSLLEAVRNQKNKEYSYGKDAWDLFHTNSVEIINRDIYAGRKKLFKKGDVLFCIRQIDLIGVIDMQNQRIAWTWGRSELQAPHHPSLLDNGNILIFDNGVYRRYSRLIELNPATGKIEWQYKADPPESFFSPTRGSAQRLPNGNTLITESDKGRAFEITKDGTIVWEFFCPEINKEKTKRATIYRLMRMVPPKSQTN